jgi:hypothetical protein
VIEDDHWRNEVVEDVEEFRQHPQTKLVATCSLGEIWVFQRQVPYFIPSSGAATARRLSPHEAVRPIIEHQWTVVDEELLTGLVSLIGSCPSVRRGWTERVSCLGLHLPRPITADQIAAATQIHDHHMPGWAASDRALDLLSETLPGFNAEEVLIKAATIDRLYYARHLRLIEAVDRIIEVMADRPTDPIAVVENIAALANADATTHYCSFASKFAHFFVDPRAVSIYDGWAIATIRSHSGRLSWKGRHPYRVFAEYVFALSDASGLCCSVRELDRYLWLSGMLRGWRANPSVGISREVRAVFESRNDEVQGCLTRLLSETGER